jgi:hypothetical protein
VIIDKTIIFLIELRGFRRDGAVQETAPKDSFAVGKRKALLAEGFQLSPGIAPSKAAAGL